MSDHFKEVEYKFIVSDEFDLQAFEEGVKSLNPHDCYTVDVTDTYYYFPSRSNVVFRHRWDDRAQDFSVKSLESSNLVRTEINLKLEMEAGDQSKSVAAFLSSFGSYKQGSLRKHVQVYLFDDCEIVYYRAEYKSAVVRCVEIEARHTKDINFAIKTIDKYAHQLGLSVHDRGELSLFEMLIKPSLEA